MAESNNYRICTCCRNKMYKGIYVEHTGEYFCSDDCMNTKYSKREYEKMYKADEAYWTTFDEDATDAKEFLQADMRMIIEFLEGEES